MVREIDVCAAAFFRSKGKGVVTENEFLMDISMTRRWMPYGDAERLLKAMLDAGVVEKDGEYVRPKFDIGTVDVPVGYRPSPDVIPASDDGGVLETLMSKAASMGIGKKDLLSMCRTLQKRMNIEVEVAALIVLRDHGADITEYLGKVYDAVSAR